ncbi:TPA: hypothetical protein L4F62_004099 [Pseudomonas aeruginosa]|uniref:hypothetical protein n=1 Tax=Pseudomonas aeruginosa TaxID=287 RepID=UPI0024B3CA1E|nr:hypothetical protein [Pseudomonas aeruginosa]CAI9794585.1 RepB-primase domain-containing protein [Pseudomonas aeruginosa]CAI9911974.1 RepB-primase domain-containing protein [Pseudomonas aeruginosa]HBO1617594.1 hypothetical protein [Pseudomonas aeruginosa]
MTQVDLGWIKALAKPQTTEERMLQSVVLSFVDSAVYECPADLLRHMNPSTRDLAKTIITSAKAPSNTSDMREMAAAADLEFGHTTKYFEVSLPVGRVRFRWQGGHRSSVRVNMTNFGEERFYQRLRYLRDRLVWELNNASASPELSAPLSHQACETAELLGLMTEEQMERVAKPQSSLDRCFQEAVLHLVDPAVYFTTIEKLAALPHEDLETVFAVLAVMDKPAIAGALVQLAKDADSAFTAKRGYIEEVKSGYRVHIRKGTERVKLSVCLNEFGEERAQKRARFLRDRVMFDIALSMSPGIMSPIVGLQLREFSKRGRQDVLYMLFRYACPSSGRYRTVRYSCRKNGFRGSFTKLRKEVANLGYEVNPDSIAGIRPTLEQFNRHSAVITDLPPPFS